MVVAVAVAAVVVAVVAPLRWRQVARRVMGACSWALLALLRLAAAAPRLVWLRPGKATRNGGCSASRLAPGMLVGALVR